MTEQSTKVLIVDDEALIAFEMADTLTDLGYEVVGPAMRLQDAMTVAQTADIDAACLDVNLGRGETSEPIAKVLSERGIPYVFISAYDATQIDFARVEDTVIPKPISGTHLKNVLMKLAA